MTHLLPMAAEHIPDVIALGRTMHAESLYRVYPYDEDQAERVCTLCCQNDGFGVVAADGQELEGMFLGLLGKPNYCDAVIAMEMIFFMLPEYRRGLAGPRMLFAFEKWAKIKNAVEINLGVHAGIMNDKICEFYERRGYTLRNRIYVHSLHA